ncbi:MAG: hypothetical protein ACPLRX_10555 [Candidatus Saccharicenans sp.]
MGAKEEGRENILSRQRKKFLESKLKEKGKHCSACGSDDGAGGDQKVSASCCSWQPLWPPRFALCSLRGFLSLQSARAFRFSRAVLSADIDCQHYASFSSCSVNLPRSGCPALHCASPFSSSVSALRSVPALLSRAAEFPVCSFFGMDVERVTRGFSHQPAERQTASACRVAFQPAVSFRVFARR